MGSPLLASRDRDNARARKHEPGLRIAHRDKEYHSFMNGPARDLPGILLVHDLSRKPVPLFFGIMR
jgi:hypothetical protein